MLLSLIYKVPEESIRIQCTMYQRIIREIQIQGAAPARAHGCSTFQVFEDIIYFFKDYSFIFERGEGRDKGRERNINVW